MKRIYLVFMFISLSVAGISCKPKQVANVKQELEVHLKGSINYQSNIPFDSLQISTFFKSYPELVKYENEVSIIYRRYNFRQIWFDENGVVEFGNSLYSKVNELDKEGIVAVFPYQNKIDGVFLDEIENTLTNTETDLMLTSLYLFYAGNVYSGVDVKTSTALEWLLPRKELSYENILDSVLLNPGLITKDSVIMFRQYFKLRDVLQKYRQIEKKGGWNTIDVVPKVKAYKPGDTSKVILQIRERLFVTGDIADNNGSNKYDDELVTGVKKYQLRNGKNPQASITPALIAEMNVPIGDRIKMIIVNMERCRWVSPEVVKASELIFVNIPSYMLYFNRNDQRVFESPVVVGKTMSKTVVFSGNMSSVVFSPYWNVPNSILEKEIKPGIKKDPNYLAKHNMEWNGGQVRQKPGPKNSLGKVKFIFPNSNNIYLHDTPSKSLFAKESRAFSHGCVRVGKPRDLAIKILENDPDWPVEKIDAAMNAGTEKWVILKTKIPVYIGYFTAWVDEKGDINFYDDIYKRDERLYDILVGADDVISK
jgi:murein L,D-transpeptidase YcbB/YkuD